MWKKKTEADEEEAEAEEEEEEEDEDEDEEKREIGKNSGSLFPHHQEYGLEELAHSEAVVEKEG